ncbi:MULTISPECIES: lipid A deacylase LpxR family protein [Roseomonadaceae]|uniref:Lipid A deacylase LpxR family protein n=1 Tax=Falsiroseomonas oleicola TaxID=2801474 RepID=A0ABS6HE09_9PROT|nr:lipid A deacylase LpxR family protein [Roseomonas oleicola]MBU8546965.1 lipid A deacylase LpxR family protein [Roseomonas oleicola]
MRKAPILLTVLLAATPSFGQGLEPQGLVPRIGEALTPTVGDVTPPAPDPYGSWTFNYENDTLGGTDSNYTSGLQLAWRSPSAELPGPLRWLNEQATRLLGPGQVRWGAGLSQAIYTPEDTQRRNPDPRDRPYAGHLYASLVLQRDTGFSLNTLELQAGVVGPAALGEFVQNTVHEAIRVDTTKGWDSQLRDELALNLVFERTVRTAPLELGGLQADMLPSYTVALGNVSTYAGAGVTFRIGQGLEADYGAPRIRPGLVGSAFFQPREEFGWYGFIGGQGRAIARDIFLDGNTWRDGGPSVDKRPLVADATAGLVVHWRGLRLAYSHVWRTEEFYGQRGGLASFGSVGFTARF